MSDVTTISTTLPCKVNMKLMGIQLISWDDPKIFNPWRFRTAVSGSVRDYNTAGSHTFGAPGEPPFVPPDGQAYLGELGTANTVFEFPVEAVATVVNERGLRVFEGSSAQPHQMACPTAPVYFVIPVIVIDPKSQKKARLEFNFSCEGTC